MFYITVIILACLCNFSDAVRFYVLTRTLSWQDKHIDVMDGYFSKVITSVVSYVMR